jgi:hypothetical protein
VIGRRLGSAVLLPALLAACPGDDGDDRPVLVVGVQAADLQGALGAVVATIKIDGVETRESIATMPREIELHGPVGARVDVSVTAAPAAPGGPTLGRIASSRIADGKRLLRVNLEARCIGIVCPSDQTCVFGRCVSPEVPPDALEDYDPAWPSAPPDICRPARRGPPEVILGNGQTDYAPLADGATLQLEKGPQGGHHIWVAARMKNLRQSGSVTTITSRLVDEPGAKPVPSAAFVFTFDPDEGAYCKIKGLRYQVDAGAVDLRAEYRRFLGKRLEVTVEIADSTGAKASSTRTVQLKDKILCSDGTETCNTP